ncbi:hypothetical protein PM10SUCC1_06120 [Propionigenium maris DSM 9537]|uniref:HutD protein n=1 Tax=Propionigenium maris DSM 9537 TaxID=1123000 RepID=A0A9W6LLX3_9FUSO|nr:HutD family protein [Propionigenium maris]GLI55097.1 hypothetical protein PM10SUCC1_06120 [Propionigenium maris DSM 9537]
MDRKNLRNIEGRPWSGGTTREIYRDQEDFNLRISSAVIDPGASKFSDYSGYRRILKVLEGEVNLRKQEEIIKLDRERVLLFGGEEDIYSESSSSVLDFNVIFREDRVKPSFLEVRKKATLITRDIVFILSLEEGSKVEFKGSCSTLDRYDLFLLREEEEKHMELIGKFIVVTWNI